MNLIAARERPLFCSCMEVNGSNPACSVHGSAGFQPADLNIFQIDITTANNLIAEWGLIAASIAQQCQWRPQGKCLFTCQGYAVCNLDGLTLVNSQGQPVGTTWRTTQPREPGT